MAQVLCQQSIQKKDDQVKKERDIQRKKENSNFILPSSVTLDTLNESMDVLGPIIKA